MSSCRYRIVLKYKNMNPTSFVLIISVIIFLLPFGSPEKPAAKSEKEIKNSTSVSVNLNLNTSPEKMSDSKNSQIKETYELTPEYLEEDPLQIEEWMKSPKSWNIK